MHISGRPWGLWESCIYSSPYFCRAKFLYNSLWLQFLTLRRWNEHTITSCTTSSNFIVYDAGGSIDETWHRGGEQRIKPHMSACWTSTMFLKSLKYSNQRITSNQELRSRHIETHLQIFTPENNVLHLTITVLAQTSDLVPSFTFLSQLVDIFTQSRLWHGERLNRALLLGTASVDLEVPHTA